MVEKKFLGQPDKTRDYVAVCQLVRDDGPDEYEIWVNLDFVHVEPYGFHKVRCRVNELSGGRWHIGMENANVGKFVVREDRNRPETEYNSDRAVSEVLGFLLASEKTGVQEIAEKQLSAEALRKAAKNRSAAR